MNNPIAKLAHWGRGHNSRSKIETLEKKAREQQIAAQKAWANLVSAQLEEDAPWSRILAIVTLTGIKQELLRKQFDVSPSTFSRWVGGFHSPSQSLRSRLGQEILRLVEMNKNKIPVLDETASEHARESSVSGH